MGAAHHGHRYRQLVANQRARRLPCWLCGQPIDYTLGKDDGRSFSYDHAVPVTDPHHGAALALDPTNGRSAHLDCNRHRGNRKPEPALGATSEQW